MNNDLVPEENAQEYHHLLAALRSSSQKHIPIGAREQIEILARVQERVAQITSTTALPDTGAFTSQHPFIPHHSLRPTKKSSRLVAHLLASCVVIGLILGSWALFVIYPSSHKTPISPSASEQSPVAQAQSNGLEASIRVLIGGPYFLSELLPVDVSFTNHSQRPAGLDGSLKIMDNSIANLCFPSALLVQVTKGNNPSYTFPNLGGIACTQPYFVTEVEPGQTLTIHQYVPLTKSGEVTLTRGVPHSDRTGNPLDQQWPTVQVQVQVTPQVLQNRTLSLLHQQGQVMISVPAGAKAHLLYKQSITCDGYNLGNAGQWTHLSTNVLQEPICPTAHRHWTYAVSAPGYMIVSGSQAT